MEFFQRNMFKMFFAIATVAIATSSAYALDDSVEKLSFTQLLNDKRELNLSANDVTDLKNRLWRKYMTASAQFTELHNEYNNRALTFGDKVMRFSLEKRGNAPSGGYPLYIALHGGGNAPASLNDSQWRAMQTYYRDSVKDGIYVAPRGITNNWNLHFDQESYPLYDKLIESAVLFDNVDPNRVYFVGFSAGGDGIYQIAARMPDRIAAANMSAGHNNWLTFDNLYNLPFAMQVGEFDSAYNRNHVTVENYIAINDLQTKYQGGYKHDVFVHFNGSHNNWRDNDATRKPQVVMSDPIGWLNNKNRNAGSSNTNAIDWMNHYSRQATPTKIVWDLKVGAKRREYQTGAMMLAKEGCGDTTSLAKPQTLFYWLDASVMTSFPEEGKLVVEVIKASNTIKVSEVNGVNKFRILLNHDLVNFAAPVNVEVAGKQVATVNVKQTLSTMARTLLERSDMYEVYNAEVVLTYDEASNSWQVTA